MKATDLLRILLLCLLQGSTQGTYSTSYQTSITGGEEDYEMSRMAQQLGAELTVSELSHCQAMVRQYKESRSPSILRQIARLIDEQRCLEAFFAAGLMNGLMTSITTSEDRGAMIMEMAILSQFLKTTPVPRANAADVFLLENLQNALIGLLPNILNDYYSLRIVIGLLDTLMERYSDDMDEIKLFLSEEGNLTILLSLLSVYANDENAIISILSILLALDDYDEEVLFHAVGGGLLDFISSHLIREDDMEQNNDGPGHKVIDGLLKRVFTERIRSVLSYAPILAFLSQRLRSPKSSVRQEAISMLATAFGLVIRDTSLLTKNGPDSESSNNMQSGSSSELYSDFESMPSEALQRMTVIDEWRQYDHQQMHENRMDLGTAELLAILKSSLLPALALAIDAESFSEDGFESVTSNVDGINWSYLALKCFVRITDATAMLRDDALLESIINALQSIINNTKLLENLRWTLISVRHRCRNAIHSYSDEEFLHGGTILLRVLKLINAQRDRHPQLDRVLSESLRNRPFEIDFFTENYK